MAVPRGDAHHLRRRAEPDQRVPGQLYAALFHARVFPVRGRNRDDARDRLEHPVLLSVLRHLLPDSSGLSAGERDPARTHPRGAGADGEPVLDVGHPRNGDRRAAGIRRAL